MQTTSLHLEQKKMFQKILLILYLKNKKYLVSEQRIMDHVTVLSTKIDMKVIISHNQHRWKTVIKR